MTPESVTLIGKAVSAEAKGRQPSSIERSLVADMRQGLGGGAGQLMANDCEPGEETGPLTPARIAEMADRLGLRNRPANPFPPNHPLYGAWEIEQGRRQGLAMEYPTC